MTDFLILLGIVLSLLIWWRWGRGRIWSLMAPIAITVVGLNMTNSIGLTFYANNIPEHAPVPIAIHGNKGLYTKIKLERSPSGALVSLEDEIFILNDRVPFKVYDSDGRKLRGSMVLCANGPYVAFNARSTNDRPGISTVVSYNWANTSELMPTLQTNMVVNYNRLHDYVKFDSETCTPTVVKNSKAAVARSIAEAKGIRIHNTTTPGRYINWSAPERLSGPALWEENIKILNEELDPLMTIKSPAPPWAEKKILEPAWSMFVCGANNCSHLRDVSFSMAGGNVFAIVYGNYASRENAGMWRMKSGSKGSRWEKVINRPISPNVAFSKDGCTALVSDGSVWAANLCGDGSTRPSEETYQARN